MNFLIRNMIYIDFFYLVRLMEVGIGGMLLGIIGLKVGNGISLKWI